MEILCTIGTRPEAIKMSPVIKAFRQLPRTSVRVVSTGQHRELLASALSEFGINSDVDLKVMRHNQSLSDLTGRLFGAFAGVLQRESPAIVLAQGDTTTVFVASVVSFYLGIPFGHVEAGLRTGDLRYPFPEEFNRIVAGRTATLHFAPTLMARNNLIREGIPESCIHLTGNTVIDALLSIADSIPDEARNGPRRRILMTVHRRENFGRPISEVFQAIRDLVSRRPDLEILYPVHPNPNVSEPAQHKFGSLTQVRLSPPLNYRQLVTALKWCDIVLTDSGGLQEEAPALGKPVLILREATERPEAIAHGVAKPVGTSRQRIISEVVKLLEDDESYRAMAIGCSPYGDGHASERIVTAVCDYLARPNARHAQRASIEWTAAVPAVHSDIAPDVGALTSFRLPGETERAV
jgi:UDP-N-acetylglucosamine 2-epimerase (non-hydrolysing)